MFIGQCLFPKENDCKVRSGDWLHLKGPDSQQSPAETSSVINDASALQDL